MEPVARWPDFAPPGNAAHAAFTGLFCIRRLYLRSPCTNCMVSIQVSARASADTEKKAAALGLFCAQFHQ